MFSLARFSLAAVASVTCFALCELFQFAYHQLTSPLRHLRGPKPANFLYGSVEDLRNPGRLGLYDEWARKYGNTMKLKGFFNKNQLFTVDARAVNYILARNYDYQKHPFLRYRLAQIFGEGLLIAEGDQHRRQRRIMSPAFGPGQVRALTGVFLEKAARLRGLWLSEIAECTDTATGVCIDVVPWLNRLTLDVIGLTGFNYDFGALRADGRSNKLNEAFSTMASAIQKLSILSVLQMWIPPLRLVPSERRRKVHAAQDTMVRIGRELLADAKSAVRAGATAKGEIEKECLKGRDLLSLLVKANMATDVPEHQKLSDTDVLAQVPTFLLAGHDTTSTAVVWALYAMTQAPEVQTKLRHELLCVNTDTPSMDILMGLPYLDTVVRETLRVYPPVPTTGRIAMKDDVVPVEKPFTDRHGVVHHMIRKGDAITISYIAMNHSTALWGPDAHEFKPERWTQIPEAASQMSGVWGNVLSFGSGPKGCIGYRFALAEIKAILFMLMRAFEFELGVPAGEIGSKTSIVQRPVLRSDPTNKPQLPLLIRPYHAC